MANKTVDARGLSCPQPVLMTKKALDSLQGNSLEVIVDNATARENVTRFAVNAGCKVSVTEDDGDFCLTLTK